MKRFLHIAFGNVFVNLLMVIGAVLLAVALYFGVNPVDGSVVDSSVRGSWIPIFLFFASLPAMAVMFVAAGGPIGLPLMYLAQMLTYWTLGRAVLWLFSFFSETDQ